TPADQQQPPLRVWVRSAHRGIRIEWHAAGGKSVPHNRRVVERRAHGGARADAELLYRALSRSLHFRGGCIRLLARGGAAHEPGLRRRTGGAASGGRGRGVSSNRPGCRLRLIAWLGPERAWTIHV